MELREFIVKFGSFNIKNDKERYWRIIVNCFLVDRLEQVLLEALPPLFKHYYGRFASFNNGELPALLQEVEFKSICHTKIIQSAVWIQPSDFLQRIVNNSLVDPTTVNASNNTDDDYNASQNNPFVQLAQKEKEEQHYEARFGKLTLEEFSCGICFELLKDAVEGNCCKNLFCLPCIEKYGRKCPNCRKVVAWTPNEPIRRLISKKPIKCDYKDCTVWSTIGEIEKHRITCEFNPDNAIAQTETKIQLRNKYERLRLEYLTKYAGVILFITNLDEDITEGQLWSGFGQFYGNMRAARVLTDNRGVNTAFIWFTTFESAQRAFEKMNGRVLPGFSQPMHIHLRVPDPQRRRKLMQQHNTRISGVKPHMIEELYKSFHSDQNDASDVVARDHVPRHGQHSNRRQSYRTYKKHFGPDSSRGAAYQSRGNGYHNHRNNNRNQYYDRPSTDAVSALRQQSKVISNEEQEVPQLSTKKAQVNFDQQRNALGDLLYARVMQHLKSIKENTQLAGKITGMILDNDNYEGLMDMLNDNASLIVLTEDALNLLKEEQS